MCIIDRREVKNVDPKVYLLGQVFDSIQFNYQHNYGKSAGIDTFDRKYTKGAIYNLDSLLATSCQYQVSPIWLMENCFDMFQFANRKRKYLPLLKIGNLDQKHILSAYQAKVNYIKKAKFKYDKNMNYYPYINDFMRSVINYFNYDNIESAKQSARVEMKQALNSFYNEPYLFDKDKELLRQHLVKLNRPWESMLLLDGISSFNSLLFLIASHPVTALLSHSNPSEVNYYYFGFKDAKNNAIDPHELLYIKRSYEYLRKEGLVVE